jgi:TonB family protein
VVRGSLDRDLIQRIVRVHVPSVRDCYERQLAKAPTLAGRVSLRFVISHSGSVVSAKVQSSTLGQPDVESCVLRAIKRITFPPPAGGGVVIVTYPFQFKTAP